MTEKHGIYPKMLRSSEALRTHDAVPLAPFSARNPGLQASLHRDRRSCETDCFHSSNCPTNDLKTLSSVRICSEEQFLEFVEVAICLLNAYDPHKDLSTMTPENSSQSLRDTQQH